MGFELYGLRAIGDRFHNALTLVDLTGIDQPLVYVNRAFLELTGYEEQDVLGRNCRFLQGPGTNREDVSMLRESLRERVAVFCDLLNFRKDGRSFFNRLVLLPLALDGRPHFVGMQIDSTPLIAAALARGRAFDTLKTSEMIRDRVNTPLMKIWTATDQLDDAAAQEEILHQAFSEILATVRALPFNS